MADHVWKICGTVTLEGFSGPHVTKHEVERTDRGITIKNEDGFYSHYYYNELSDPRAIDETLYTGMWCFYAEQVVFLEQDIDKCKGEVFQALLNLIAKKELEVAKIKDNYLTMVKEDEKRGSRSSS